jgi:hypothetical protein
MLAALKFGPYLALALMGSYVMVLRANVETLEVAAQVYESNEVIFKNEVAEGNKQILACIANTEGLITTVRFHQDQSNDAREMYESRLQDITNYERKLKDAVTADPSRAADNSSKRKFDRMQSIEAASTPRSNSDRSPSAAVSSAAATDNQSPPE